MCFAVPVSLTKQSGLFIILNLAGNLILLFTRMGQFLMKFSFMTKNMKL